MKRTTAGKIGFFAIPAVIGIVYTVWMNSRPVIERLEKPTLRLRAFYQEYSKITDLDHLPEFPEFRHEHNAVRLMKIPVKGAPERPLYLLHRNIEAFNPTPRTPYSPPPWNSFKSFSSLNSWQTWWQSSSPTVEIPEVEDPQAIPFSSQNILSLFSSEGVLLDEKSPRPFAGSNLTEIGEVIYDINNDGWVERVTEGNFTIGDPAIHGTVATIFRINRATDRIFNVVTNLEFNGTPTNKTWGISNEWSFRCEDVDSDGTLELQIGPKRINGFLGIIPKVTFFWNETSQTFESPSGKIGAHFMVMETDADWAALAERVDSGEFRYPLDQ